VAGDDAGSGDEVLAALVASLRAELAGSQAALARAVEELAAARASAADVVRVKAFSDSGGFDLSGFDLSLGQRHTARP